MMLPIYFLSADSLPKAAVEACKISKTETHLKHSRKHGTDARELVEVSLGLGQAVGHQDRLFCAVLVCMPKILFLGRLRVRIPPPVLFCFFFLHVNHLISFLSVLCLYYVMYGCSR